MLSVGTSGNSASVALNVNGTMSGKNLYVSGTGGVRPLFGTFSSMKQIGVLTATPTATFDIAGSLHSNSLSVRYTPLSAHFTSASDQYLSIADNASLRAGSSDFTMSAWVYLDSTAASQTIISKWNQTSNPGCEYLSLL